MSIISQLLLLPITFLQTLVSTFTYLSTALCRNISYDHFAPHSAVGFEGYYSRTLLEDGATLAVVYCWVSKAKHRRNYVHVSFTAAPGTSSIPSFQYNLFPDAINVITPNEVAPSEIHRSFSLNASGIGTMDVSPNSINYTISVPNSQLSLNLCLTAHTPWSPSDPLAGPMGFLLRLSSFLPLNWHVRSISSIASYTLMHARHTLQGTGVAHVEKNWGTSFPSGWIWSQTMTPGDDARHLCLAGGYALPGVQAYLLGYRSSKYSWDLTPPFSAAIGSFSPFMHVQHDSRKGEFVLTIQTLYRKLEVKIKAPPGSFIGLAAPLSEGHRPSFAFESFGGETRIRASTRPWPWGQWIVVEEGVCGLTSNGMPCSALEFGGSFSHLVNETPKMR